MGIGVQGDFSDPPRSATFRDTTKSKVTLANLNASGLRIVVLSLYAHPWLNRQRSVKGSIDRQIDRAERFILENPEWVIAGSAVEARTAVAQKRKVLILSLETSAGVLDSVEDRRHFIDQRRVRIVTFLHLSPDANGSPALLRGWGMAAAPLEWIRSFFGSDHSDDGVFRNVGGLTPAGVVVLKDLVARRVWIDLAHASDRSQAEMIPILRDAGQPLLYSHVTLRSNTHEELGISESQLRAVNESGGLIGMIPSGYGLPHGDLADFAASWIRAARDIAPERILLGTDSNGPVKGLAPGVSSTELPLGYFRVDQLPALSRDLRTRGAPISADASATVQNFLHTWERVWTGSAIK